MSGPLASIYSFGDSLKRKLGGLLDDPSGTVTQFVNNLNDNAKGFNELTAAATDEGIQSIKSGRGLLDDGPASQQLITKLAESYSPMVAIDPKGQKRLVDGLLGPGNTERYRLGDVKPKQAEALDNANGVPSRGLMDVFMAPSPEDHIRTRRVIDQNISPESVGVYAKQAMLPSSDVLPPATRSNYAALSSRPTIDPKTGEVYQATMPLRTVDDGFEVVTIVPKGKRGKR